MSKISLMIRIFLLIITILYSFSTVVGQGLELKEETFIGMKSYVTAIGIAPDRIHPDEMTSKTIPFQPIGSGIFTYVKYKEEIIYAVITARHVVNYFDSKSIKNIFIRPSWADTIKTTSYYGLKIPLINGDGIPNIYYHPDKNIDIACILIPSFLIDSTSFAYFRKNTIKMFPIESLISPELGDNVWIMGYAGHIQSQIQKEFDYCISTFKPGIVVWRSSSSMKNEDLNHIALVESNATFGNSGGPVFADKNGYIRLVGLLVSGFSEMDTVFLNNKPIYDDAKKDVVLSRHRSGVSIIEKSEFIFELLEDIEKKLNVHMNVKRE